MNGSHPEPRTFYKHHFNISLNIPLLGWSLGYRGGDHEEYYLAVQIGEYPIFRRNLPSPSSGSKIKASKLGLLSRLLACLFDPDDGGDMFLRNVGLSPNYTAMKYQE
jgi:hypothetical protein